MSINKYTTNYWDYMDFIGGEVKFYKNDNYYCSIKLLSLQEYLWEEYNEIISLLYMNEPARLEFAKKVFPHIVVKTTRDFFVALFQFYDKQKIHFDAFSKLFPWIEKLKFGFGVNDEMIEEETLAALINHFLYYNSFKDKIELPIQRELTAAEKRKLEMEERIKKIKQQAAANKDGQAWENKQGDGFSYGKAITIILKEFQSLTIKDIMNLPVKGFFALFRVGSGYSYHLAEVIAAGNGLIKKITHYTEERKNE